MWISGLGKINYPSLDLMKTILKDRKKIFAPGMKHKP